MTSEPDRAPLYPAPMEGPDGAQWGNTVANRLFWGRKFWKPLHDRMDYGMTMYLLLDAVQQMKPVGMRRFISNDPRTAIDSAVNILTRNEPYWRIDLAYDMAQEERETVSKVEAGLAGIVDDLNSMFYERGDSAGFWEQAAWWSLSRGAIWGKFAVTKDAIRMGRQAPLLGEFWDPRMVYPNFDGIGLESVVVEKQTTFIDLYTSYPGAVTASLARTNTPPGSVDPNSPAVKIEYWSNDRLLNTGLRPGVYAVLGYFATTSDMTVDPVASSPQSACWLVDPMYHQYTPANLPVVGMPVNGIPIKQKPQFGAQVLASMNARARQLGLTTPTWHDPNGWTAEWGRGLLTTVEELMPQYNEMVATALQHFTQGTYPTWVFNTQNGELPDWEDGVNARVALRIGEDVRQFAPPTINQDAWRILEILRGEKQRGMLDGILQAQGAADAASGIVLQQAINTALNNLNPYGKGLVNFGGMFGSHMLEQLKVVDTGTLSLVKRGSRSYFRITFNPATDLTDRKYKPEPIFKPAVPEDLLLKAQVARLLLDPRMPIMSLVTVLDKIFQLEDPEGENKRMMEDIANRDPIILLERIADILAEQGEDEMAARIRQKEFQARYQEQAQMMNLQAQMAQLMAFLQQTGAPAAEAAGQDAASGLGQGFGQGAEGLGLASSSGSAESTGAGQPRPGQGGSGGGGPDVSALSSIGGA